MPMAHLRNQWVSDGMALRYEATGWQASQVDYGW